MFALICQCFRKVGSFMLWCQACR